MFSYGRWSEWKNLDLVFSTYDNLKNKTRELVLMIWWVWPDLDFYKKKYEDDKNIIFLWLIDKNQIIENLEKSSLLLFPSKIDSFWLVILESMSIWVPVISFNIAWAKEIITNWINWYLVNTDSEFTDKAYEILVNSSHRNNLSIEAIKTAKTFSEDTFKKSLSDVFNTMK
jgi:glycosyltransferase involved in cell wall biosynthesis